MADTIRWGILSTARIAETAFIPATRETKRGTIAAVGSRDAERAKAFAGEHEIPLCFGSYEELLASDEIDAIYNPLPNSMHAEWTKKAAAAGKHVFCEKPLGVDAAECDDMVAACETAGILFFEAFVFLYHPQSAAVRQVLTSGRIGDLVQAQVSFTFPLKRPTDNIRMNKDLAGGSLMDVGCYPITYARFLFDEEPHAVQAACAFDADYGVDTRASIILTFSGDRHASLQQGFDAPGGQRAIVHGSQGYVEIPQPCHPGAEAHFVVHDGDGEERIDVNTGLRPFAPAIEHFQDCLLDGVEPLYTAANAAGSMRIIDAVRASHHTGARVDL